MESGVEQFVSQVKISISPQTVCVVASFSAALNVMTIHDFQCCELNMGSQMCYSPLIKLHLCAVKSPCLSRCHNGGS